MKKCIRRCVVFLTGLSSLIAFGVKPADSIGRWYNQEHLTIGKRVFQEHCRDCHGEQAASVSSWDKMDRNGQFPPPPLDGTAHTWHHSLPLLRRTIREGGIVLGGQMPAFKEKLSSREIDAVIAWFQSYWPDDIYANWIGEPLPHNLPKKTPWSLKEFLKQ